MGVKDLIKKMEELAADAKSASSSTAPSDKAAAPATQPAAAEPAEAAPEQSSKPVAEPTPLPASSAPAANGLAKENGSQFPATAAPGKEPEDPEKKAKKVCEPSCNTQMISVCTRCPVSAVRLEAFSNSACPCLVTQSVTLMYNAGCQGQSKG